MHLLFLQHIQFARDEAVAWGKIPVFLDTKGDSDVDNFFQYQKVQMVEARWCFQVTQIDKSKTVEEVQEHLRKKLVAAMKVETLERMFKASRL